MSEHRKWDDPTDTYVDLSSDEAVARWTGVFGVGAAELHQAVQAVGHSEQNVKAWLTQQGHLLENDI